MRDHAERPVAGTEPQGEPCVRDYGATCKNVKENIPRVRKDTWILHYFCTSRYMERHENPLRVVESM